MRNQNKNGQNPFAGRNTRLVHTYFIVPGKKIYRVKVLLPIAPKKLIAAMMDSEKITEWNTTLTKNEILKVI